MIWRGGVNALLFLAGLVLGCGAIQRALPLPDVPQVKEKLEWLRQHRGEYSALFLGTSRVRRHVVPALFDRLAAEQGIALRSFNLGVDSLFAPEDGYVLERALAATAGSLRFVFVELSYFRQDFAGQGPETVRAAYWHDFPRTTTVLRQLVAEDWRRIKPRKKRKRDPWRGWLADVTAWSSLAAQHLRLFAQRAANLGRGSALLQLATGTRTATANLAPLGPALDGFIPSEDDSSIRGALLADYQRQLAGLQAAPRQTLPLDEIPQQNLERMLAAIRRAGAQPILFLAPTSSGIVFRPRRAVAPLLDFSDPRASPQLFDPRHRADLGHLNSAGADAFTRALFERFLPLAENPQHAKPQTGPNPR